MCKLSPSLFVITGNGKRVRGQGEAAPGAAARPRRLEVPVPRAGAEDAGAAQPEDEEQLGQLQLGPEQQEDRIQGLREQEDSGERES